MSFYTYSVFTHQFQLLRPKETLHGFKKYLSLQLILSLFVVVNCCCFLGCIVVYSGINIIGTFSIALLVLLLTVNFCSSVQWRRVCLAGSESSKGDFAAYLFSCTRSLHIELSRYLLTFLASIESEGRDALGKGDAEKLWKVMVQWQAALNALSDQFSGELLLERQEKLQELQSAVAEWSDLILCVMRRHPDSQDGDDPERARTPTSDSRTIMMSVNGKIDSFMKNITARMCGENGRSDINKKLHRCIYITSFYTSLHVSGSLLRIQENTLSLMISILHELLNGLFSPCCLGVAVGFVHVLTPMETW